MSSSPWEWLWNGDEDVATPLNAGAVSKCARAAGLQEIQSGMLTSLGGKAFFRPVRGLGSSMAEQLTLNQLVLGSSPSRGTNFRCA
jgi:hypothetical protein